MPSVLPSDVRGMIEDTFPWVRTTQPPRLALLSDGPAVAALVELVDLIPEALLPLSSDEHRDFVWAAAGLRHLVKRLETGQVSAGGGWPWPTVWINPLNAVTCLWQLLEKCPDQGIAATTADLNFVDDESLRQSVRLDLSSSQEALNNGQWKAATVLAGSAIEALLLYAILQQSAPEREAALTSVRQRVRLDDPRPENWTLSQYVEMGLELRQIAQESAIQIRLAKDYRNLIHPGREIRKHQRSDRATALSAMAALHHVIRDLSTGHPQT